MNFLVGILLIVITYGVIGIPIASNSNVIGEVVQGSPAMAAGLQSGDRIISINDVATENWEDVSGNIRKNGGQELKLVVERDNERHLFFVKPKYDLNLKYIRSVLLSRSSGKDRVSSKRFGLV